MGLFRRNDGAPFPRRVLVAEDDALFRDYVREVLLRRDYVVEAVANGQDAVERIHRCVYDVVVTDVQMDPGDGLMLIERLSVVQPAARVILMSGRLTPTIVETAKGLGVKEFLPKPFSPSLLESAVDRALAAPPPVYARSWVTAGGKEA